MITPILKFHSTERWFPVGVEESLHRYGHEWKNDTFYRGKTPVDRLDFPPDMQPLDFPLVGYHKTIAAEHIWWQVFGLWYLYNPKEYAWRGQHEGDWEFVVIGTTDRDGNRPCMVWCSQHTEGAFKVFWDCERRPQTKFGRPVIYVGEGSHANYFNRVHTAIDDCDGRGALALDIEWREFGPWFDWHPHPHCWGNSENSPGPLSTRKLFRDPAHTVKPPR